jgi:YbbR domain-containing protein
MFKYRYHIVLASFLLSSLLWLSLNLNQIYEIERTVPVNIRINKPYAVSGNVPLNLEVRFRGVGWNLIRLFTSFNLEFNYDINTRKKDQFTILTKEYLENNLMLSQGLNITAVYPDTLFVKIENYEEKYVKLLPNLEIIPRDGYQVVGKPVLEPDSVKVGGGEELLKNLDFIYTKFILFENVNSSIERNITISDSLANIISVAQNEVRLNVDIELTAEKEFSNILLTVPNTPEDKDVLLIPQTVTIQLKGGVNQLSQVDAGRIRAYIDFNAILSDSTGSLVPVFELPDGCTVISVKPEMIQYVIKKKS